MSLQERITSKLEKRGFYWEHGLLVKGLAYTSTHFDSTYRNTKVYIKVGFEDEKCFVGHQDWEENTIDADTINEGKEVVSLEQIETYHSVELNRFGSRKDLEPVW